MKVPRRNVGAHPSCTYTIDRCSESLHLVPVGRSNPHTHGRSGLWVHRNKDGGAHRKTPLDTKKGHPGGMTSFQSLFELPGRGCLPIG